MLGQAGPAAPGANGTTGSQGPAPGIRSAARTQVVQGQGRGIRADRDGSITFETARRLGSRTVTRQQTVEPVTPLKTQGERMRGGNVDVRA